FAKQRRDSHAVFRVGSRVSVRGLVALLLALSAAVIVESRSMGAEARSGAFVSVEGAHFILQDHRLAVAGINNHYLTFGSKAEVDRVLDDATAMGANVVRTFIQPVIGSLDGKRAPTIWDWRKEASSNDLGVHGGYVLFWDDH